MSALTVARPGKSAGADGMARAARLMRALGPEAAPVWSELSTEEASALSAAMDALPEDFGGEAKAVDDFVSAHAKQAARTETGGTIWTRLSALETGELLRIAGGQHPQSVALILSCLAGDASARLLRALDTAFAVDVMQRLLHIGPVHPAAISSLETALAGWLHSAGRPARQGGHERIARILDRLDGRAEKSLLAALESAEPGAGEKIRALMFTFDDLARLDAGGLQTLLSSADRAVLTVALKGAREETTAAFFRNMTQRAGDLLREEISMLGPVRRSEVEAARLELVTLARTLISRGDIRAGAGDDEDELVD